MVNISHYCEWYAVKGGNASVTNYQLLNTVNQEPSFKKKTHKTHLEQNSYGKYSYTLFILSATLLIEWAFFASNVYKRHCVYIQAAHMLWLSSFPFQPFVNAISLCSCYAARYRVMSRDLAWCSIFLVYYFKLAFCIISFLSDLVKEKVEIKRGSSRGWGREKEENGWPR